MSTRRRLTSAVAPVGAAMALSIVARILQLGAGIALAGAGAWGVAALATGDLSHGRLLLAALAVLAVIKAGAAYVEQYQGHHVAFGLLAEMRTDFFRRVEPLAPAALADTRSGDLVDRVMSDVDRIEVFYAHTLAPAAAAVVVPTLAVVGVSTWASLRLGLIVAAAMLLVGFVVPSLSTRAARGRADDAASAAGALAAHVTDGIQGLGEAVVFDYGPHRLEEMGHLADEVGAAEAAAARIDGARAGLNQLVVGATVLIVAALGLSEVEAGAMDLPTLVGALAVTLVAFGPLRDIQQVKPSFDRAMAAADRIFSISDRPPVVTDPDDPLAPEGQPTLRFERATFAYPGRKAGVRDIDLTVGPGSKVAVVGPSGAGKSTLADLAVRFWDPDSGRVALGDVDVSRLRLADLRRTVTVVAQESHLFSGTVADNLRLGRPGATDEELRRVARAVAIAEEIEDLPHAYDTEVGELGIRLSGGQRQRIALARGLLSRSPVLVLDEATSDLDVDTEALVLERLRTETAERALVVIAHRLATVVDADQIMVMEGGQIVARGTHQHLLSAGGLYARLWARQRDEL